MALKGRSHLVGLRWNREQIEEWEDWDRKNNRWKYEDGQIFNIRNKRGSSDVELWLADTDRVTLDQWNRFYREDRHRLQPHQLPEDLDSPTPEL